jgi:hypothetical protein
MVTVLASIITRSHPCQQDLGDEEDHDVESGTSEFDWLVVDTAMDVVTGMAAAMGPHFAEHWNVFQKPIVKYASSQESLERATATGAIAEMIRYLDTGVTPFTEPLAKILLHRLSDNDLLAKSNAAFAIGQLIITSGDANVLNLYEEVAMKLEPALAITDSRMQDNVAGCFSRMMMRNPDPAVVAKLLPEVVKVLPLKEDYEENAPIYECIYMLCMSAPCPLPLAASCYSISLRPTIWCICANMSDQMTCRTPRCRSSRPAFSRSSSLSWASPRSSSSRRRARWSRRLSRSSGSNSSKARCRW